MRKLIIDILILYCEKVIMRKKEVLKNIQFLKIATSINFIF